MVQSLRKAPPGRQDKTDSDILFLILFIYVAPLGSYPVDLVPFGQRLVMTNRYLIITRTPSGGIEFGLAYSLGAWKGLQHQTHVLVLQLC